MRSRPSGARRPRPNNARLFASRGPRSEDHFIGVGANKCRYRFSRRANGLTGSPADNVVAGVRVAERSAPARGHSFQDAWIHRRCRLIVRVDRVRLVHFLLTQLYQLKRRSCLRFFGNNPMRISLNKNNQLSRRIQISWFDSGIMRILETSGKPFAIDNSEFCDYCQAGRFIQ